MACRAATTAGGQEEDRDVSDDGGDDGDDGDAERDVVAQRSQHQQSCRGQQGR